jgi:hypothetical protein
VSVFILEGNSLKAVLIVEGPFANPDVDSTTDLLAAEQKFVVDKYRWTKHTMNREVVNFEHLQLPEPEFEEDEEMIVPSLEGEEDDDTVREGEDMPALQARIEERRQRQQIARRKMQEARRKRAERLLEHRKENAAIVKNEGSPHQRTIKAGVDGWFRGCVSAEFNSVSCLMSSISTCNNLRICLYPILIVSLPFLFRLFWSLNSVQRKNLTVSIRKLTMSIRTKNGRSCRKTRY